MGASLQRPGSSHRALSEITVTPFVDVALVLLIIFMVTAPMMQQGVDVDLPETTTQPLRVKDEPLILTVQKNGKYFLGQREIPAAELRGLTAAIDLFAADCESDLRRYSVAPDEPVRVAQG